MHCRTLDKPIQLVKIVNTMYGTNLALYNNNRNTGTAGDQVYSASEQAAAVPQCCSGQTACAALQPHSTSKLWCMHFQ